jgi:hypothetical protein
MQTPLGYLREDGSVHFNELDRAAERFIRAELQLLVRSEHEKEARRERTLRSKVAGLLYSKRTRAFTSAVGFENLMTVLLLWRLPVMVPHHVKVRACCCAKTISVFGAGILGVCACIHT